MCFGNLQEFLDFIDDNPRKGALKPLPIVIPVWVVFVELAQFLAELVKSGRLRMDGVNLTERVRKVLLDQPENLAGLLNNGLLEAFSFGTATLNPAAERHTWQ